MTSPAVDFHPNWASAPGDTILDILDERGLSIDEFATSVGMTSLRANELIEGRATITIRIAKSLERALGGSVEFWVARDYQYRESVARIQQAGQDWLGKLPLGDMIRFGWLDPPPKANEELDACLRFFGVRSISAWRAAYQGIEAQVAFRTSRKFDSRPAAVAAWLRKGELEAARIECVPWDADRFAARLQSVRQLTREREPRVFISALQKACAACGVAVVIVRSPTGCRASGATRFISREKAILQLSFRYLSDDQFWFTFFHEAGHLLLHGGDGLFLEGLESGSSRHELEANAFAENIIIPEDAQSDLNNLRLDAKSIARFAKRIGISAGIVVGQLQHRQRIPASHFNGLKNRFKWIES